MSNITGDLYFSLDHGRTPDGQKIVLVLGVMAVPDENCALKNGYKYVVESNDDGVTFHVNLSTGQDIGSPNGRCFGWLPENILAEKHWRFKEVAIEQAKEKEASHE